MKRTLPLILMFAILSLQPACGDDKEAARICQGEPTACALIDVGTCYWQDGCQVFDDCSGIPWQCNMFASVAACGAQHGCTWSTATSTCTGTPWACDQMDDAPEWCNEQEGCSSQTACGDFGVRVCEDALTLQECDRVEGCLWE